MKRKVLRSITLSALLVVAVAALAVSQVLRESDAKAPAARQEKAKTLRDIAAERDVETEEGIESGREYATLEELKKEATAVVYGRITDSKSFFDESGHPIEHGDYITTEYTVEVNQVLRNRTLNGDISAGKPAPLTTPLKIARNGGVVEVNGHRAAVKAKGFESLTAGKSYVFFLSWSPDYQAYTLAGGVSGAVLVNDDLSLKPLASSDAIQSKLRGASLNRLIEQVR